MSEIIVFGCDDLWNHIKSFLFHSCECWAKDYSLRLGPCEGKVSMAYVQKHECVYSKQITKYRFTKCLYTCNYHKIK